MVKRIPIIVFVLSILSLVYMLIIRLNAMGMRLLTMNSRTGRFVAGQYYASVIIFVIVLAVFAVTILVVSRIRKKKGAQANEEELMFAAGQPDEEELMFASPQADAAMGEAQTPQPNAGAAMGEMQMPQPNAGAAMAETQTPPPQADAVETVSERENI